MAPVVGHLARSVEWFDLENNSFDEGGCAAWAPALSKLTSMLGLFLFGNKIDGAGMKLLAPALCKMPKLYMLHLVTWL